MKTLIFTALLLASANLNASDFDSYTSGSPEHWRGVYQERLYNQQRMMNNEATVIPQYGGGYRVVKPWGTTNYSAPDSLGVINIRRQGVTTW